MKLPELERKTRRAFQTQRQTTKRRVDAAGKPIAWDLSYEQWRKVWDDSGKLAQRGRGPDDYVMSRKDDLGPYAADNVEIIPFRENVKRGAWPKKQGCVAPNKGRTRKGAPNRTIS